MSGSSAPYFEDLRVGLLARAAPAVTLTDGMAALHQAIVGDRLRLALDATTATSPGAMRFGRSRAFVAGVHRSSSKERAVNWKLELIVIPVTDVDRAKAFYVEQAGFDLHVDHSAGEDFRVVQLNPPGVPVLDRGDETARSRRRGAGPAPDRHRHLRSTCRARGPRGPHQRGISLRRDGTGTRSEPERRDCNSFVSFSDPDGTWLAQEVKREPAARLT